MVAQNPYIQNLQETNCLSEPVYRSAIQALQLPLASRGLDLGCGIGLQSILLAEAVGPQGQVTAVDIDTEQLAYGKGLRVKAGYPENITFAAADMHWLPFRRVSFDWAWSADCVGYPSGDLIPLLSELKRVLAPGGSIILLVWSSQNFLPGYPFLEAWLNANCSSYVPYLEKAPPANQYLNALRWFEELGLEEVSAQTFVGDVRAPLNQEERIALESLLRMLWQAPAEGERLKQWQEYLRLSTQGSPDFILDQPGYYAFFTYTMFRGKVPIM